MRINKLILTGFSAHKNTTIEFPESEKVTFVCGTLNAGKSSIAQAIELAMTGECERYRKRTDDHGDFIHDLAGGDPIKRFSITVETDSGIATRAKTTSGASTFNWVTGSRSIAGDEGRAVMLDKVGVPANVITTLTQTSDIFDRDAKDQKELLFNLVPPVVEWAKIKAMYADAGYDPKGLEIVGEVSSLPAIDAAYKAAYEERREVNRDLDSLKPMDPPEGDVPDIDAIKAKLNGLDADRIALHGQVAALEALRKNDPGVQRARLTRELAAVEAETASAPVADAAALAAARLAVDEAHKRAQERVKKRNAAKDIISELNAAVGRSKDYVGLLKKFNGQCVAAPHPCPAPKSDMEAALGTQEEELSKKSAMLREAEMKFAQIEREALDQTEIRGLEQTFAALTAESTNVEKRRLRIVGIKEALAELPSEEGTDEDPMPALKERIRILEERIAKGKVHLEGAQGWVFRQEEVKRVASKRKALEQRKTHLENLVEFFGLKGVRVKLVDAGFAKFQAAVNEALAKYGFEFSFSADPWMIRAKGRNVNRLSRSERFRLGIALQVAIAKISGFDFILADNMEILTPDARAKTVELITAAGIGQAILITSIMIAEADFVEQRKKANPMPGVGFVLISNKGGVAQATRC